MFVGFDNIKILYSHSTTYGLDRIVGGLRTITKRNSATRLSVCFRAAI